MASQLQASSATLQLLPGAHGSPLQTWDFVDCALIHIGRAGDCDVVISNPVVSRSHAYLKVEGGRWQLAVISQNGVFVGGERVQHLELSNGVVFRLAATGPFLRFCEVPQQRSSLLQTVIPEDASTILMLDVAKRDRQVHEIAEASYFQDLQQLARRLRTERRG